MNISFKYVSRFWDKKTTQYLPKSYLTNEDEEVDIASSLTREEHSQ